MSTAPVRKRGPPPPLRLDLAPSPPPIAASEEQQQPDTTPDPGPAPQVEQSRPTSLRNMKKLSLSIAMPSSNSSVPPSPSVASIYSKRRASVASLPGASVSSILHRTNEGDSPSAPYIDGPIEIMPRVWLGSEDNARDWPTLENRGIKCILNVAKEVNAVFDQLDTLPQPSKTKAHLYPADPDTGRPELYYLKLSWSHGQADLVTVGFAAGMAFIDQAILRGDGVLIHCQCGVSRSATMVIALVMRAAASASPFTPREIASLVGMHGAYDYVKAKSKWIGPNMSLIYQLNEYERTLGKQSSPAISEPTSLNEADADAEWERQRRELDLQESDDESAREARQLDREMERRMHARKDSVGSGHGIGMGQPWRSRYGAGGTGRTRAGSLESTYTTRSSVSVLSEDLVEEDEEEEHAGRVTTPNTDATDEDSHQYQTKSDSLGLPPPHLSVPRRLHLSLPPPSAPAGKQAFTFPARPPVAKKEKRRPPPLASLAPVPPSPRDAVPRLPASAAQPHFRVDPTSTSHLTSPGAAAARVHAPGIVRPPELTHNRRRSAPPPLNITVPFPSSKRLVAGSTSTSSATSNKSLQLPQHLHAPPLQTPSQAAMFTPSQTLFVFPPSPTSTKTPSTLMLTSTPMLGAFPTPRGTMFKKEGKRTWFGASTVSTPTTATARVDARGWLGFGG